MNDRDKRVHWLPFGQSFMPSPIIPRNLSGMDCLAQFFLRERPDYFAVLGNVNRVFQTLCTLARVISLCRCGVESKRGRIQRVKYWEIIADNLSEAGWSWGWVSAIDSKGRTIWIAATHRGAGLGGRGSGKGQSRPGGARRQRRDLHRPLRRGERNVAQRVPQRASQGRGTGNDHCTTEVNGGSAAKGLPSD